VLLSRVDPGLRDFSSVRFPVSVPSLPLKCKTSNLFPEKWVIVMSIEVQVISGVGDEDVNAINRLLSARGQGVGEALAREAVRLARTAGARTVDLTSRPSREAASRLYERLGFRLRDTRAYRLADTSSDQERHT
jgi:hypothetical protein